MKALNLIERHYPSVKFLYSRQHDFSFTKDVDHLALANVMDRYPDKINWILFPKRAPHLLRPGCGNEQSILYNRTAMITTAVVDSDNGSGEISGGRHNDVKAFGNDDIADAPLRLTPTYYYSDNNHLARFHWYKETIASLIMLQRPPEYPLKVRAVNACKSNKSMGLYIYHELCLAHLDGRHSILGEGK